MILLAPLLGGCGAGSQPEHPGTTGGLPVRVTEVRVQAPPAALRLPGETRAVERMQPAFLHAGYLAERLVSRGEIVRAGDTLAILHNPALAPAVAAGEARVRELDARLRQAEKEMARVEDLHRRGVASDDDLDRVQAQRDATAESRQQAEAELDRARRHFSDANLRAPADGIVAELMAEPGDFVAAGQPILALHGNGLLEISIPLPEHAASRLKPGDPAEIIAWQTGTTARGYLREIGQAAGGKPAPAIIQFDPATALKSVASGCQTAAAGGQAESQARFSRSERSASLEPSPVQEPECTRQVHEDSEYRRTPSDARAVAIESGSGWLPGQAVHVHLEWSEPESLLVPLAALTDPGTGQARVFRVRDGRAEAVPVKTGRLHDGWVAVRVTGPGNLEPGDQVVTAGQARLLDGEKVRVLP